MMRAVLGPIAHAALILQAIASIHRSRAAAAFLLGHVAGVCVLARKAPTMPERLAGQILFLQTTGLGGMLRYLRGDRPATWPKDERRSTSGLTFQRAIRVDAQPAD